MGQNTTAILQTSPVATSIKESGDLDASLVSGPELIYVSDESTIAHGIEQPDGNGIVTPTGYVMSGRLSSIRSGEKAQKGTFTFNKNITGGGLTVEYDYNGDGYLYFDLPDTSNGEIGRVSIFGPFGFYDELVLDWSWSCGFGIGDRMRIESPQTKTYFAKDNPGASINRQNQTFNIPNLSDGDELQFTIDNNADPNANGTMSFWNISFR